MWKCFSLFLFLNISTAVAQDIELYSQFNGKYDYTAIGNTMNLNENGAIATCAINSSSQATLSLEAGQNVVAAYLYWAGSGAGDFDVKLNGMPVSAERTFSDALDDDRIFFAAFADVTQYVINTGSSNYILSELDLTNIIPPYCPTGTNFAGWAITVIYEDENLPLNQLNVYDGLQSVPESLTINLDNLNVFDNEGAKIGFVAWEGDNGISVNESLTINGNLIGNPPLNPTNNAFNGTNSFTGATNLYNMDIDFYNIQNNIEIGDTSAQIQLTSGQDFVMINNIITVLNSQVPDASAGIENFNVQCEEEEIVINFSIYNTNSTDALPAGTEYIFLINDSIVASGTTPAAIPMNDFWQSSITLDLSAIETNEFEIELIVDPENLVDEIIEDNNTASIFFNFENLEPIPALPNLEACDDGNGTAFFDLTEQNEVISQSNSLEISFFTTEEDALSNINAIETPSSYLSESTPQEIFVRYANEFCHEISSFLLEIINCPYPDASVEVLQLENACYSNEVMIEFIVYNSNATATLPAGTEVAFFGNGFELGSIYTPVEIPVDETWESSVSFSIPEDWEGEIEIFLIVDPNDSVEELLEDNNNSFDFFEKKIMDPIQEFTPMLACNEGNKTGLFNLSQHESSLTNNPETEISYFTSYEDAVSNFNEVTNPSEYLSDPTPQQIFVRYEEAGECYTIGSFILETENCPPFVPQGFSPNGDGINDTFEISGLYDIFTNFELSIYTRLGNKIYVANNNVPEWDGTVNTGINTSGEVPTGTYYYVLRLNHSGYKTMTGWVYLNR